ncbi:MAG: hypothetical protein M3N22_02240, partial [Acidobacteriota bacterium]|nr:hypothetical protein [Acidobacteriota bacterium]
MRLASAFFFLCSLLSSSRPAFAQKTPHQLYDALNAIRLNPDSVYQIAPDNHIELRRGDATISFEEGRLIFFKPLDGQITGAVFAGRGHILALPREIPEKQQLARFVGSPTLDQYFANAYLRFTDDTVREFLRQFQFAQMNPLADPALSARVDPVLAQLNPFHSLRILCGTLTAQPAPYFYASLDGSATGPFDVLLDSMRMEPFVLGQSRKSAGGAYYDVWTAHKMPDIPSPSRSFAATHYAIETSILADHSLDATTTVNLRAHTAGDHLLVFALSRALNIDRVTDDSGRALDFFQNEGMTPQERSIRGNDYLYVILPQPSQSNSEFAIHFHYRGSIISDAGNDVLFVGARESWYPHFGDSADFASYNIAIRWPRKLRLIATGSKLDEREDGDFRVGHWQTDNPVSVAGFNLGEYDSNSVVNPNYSIDVYANRLLERELARRLENTSDTSIGAGTVRHPAIDSDRNLPIRIPNPADALKQLGRQIDASIRFYELYGGPFPFRNLSVSQIPGTFGQGWPGLLYVSTFSFLPLEAQRQAGLSSSGQELFTELVPFHEVAHQWWGNIVGWSSYRDQWINESIANYLALLFADTRRNPDHTLHVWLQRYRRALVQRAPNADEPAADIGALTLGGRLDSSKSPNAYEDVIYSKGAWVIHMLREMLRQPSSPSNKDPDARFKALLHTLVTKYAYRALSTEDLRHEVEAVMTPSMDLEGGHSMEWFFEQWVQGTGIPHYRVEFSTHKTDTGYAIRGKLFQTGVPQSFIARVPLYASNGVGHAVLLGTVVAAGTET